MRKNNSVDALLSKTTQEVLAVTLGAPDRGWYLSDLARQVGRPVSSLQRPLASLVSAGVLRRREEGNRVYFQADPDCPFLAELSGLVKKTSGLVSTLRSALAPLAGGIDAAFVYGSVARSEETSESDIDLLVVGSVRSVLLAGAIRRAEEQLGRVVNAVTFTADEFRKKRSESHHFVKAVLRGPKIFLIGSEHELETAGRRKTG